MNNQAVTRLLTAIFTTAMVLGSVSGEVHMPDVFEIEAEADTAISEFLIENDTVIAQYNDVASYDKGTKTLTLRNADINVGSIGDDIKNIRVEGINTLTLSNGNGRLETSNLTIDGSGTLNFNGVILINGDLFVNDITLNVTNNVGDTHDILVMEEYQFRNAVFTFTAQDGTSSTVALDMWGQSDGHKEGLIENSTMIFNLNDNCLSAMQLGTSGNSVNLTIRNSNIISERGSGLLNFFDSKINYDPGSHYYNGYYNGHISETPTGYQEVSLDEFLSVYKDYDVASYDEYEGTMAGDYNYISTKALSDDERKIGYVLVYQENIPDNPGTKSCKTIKYGQEVHVKDDIYGVDNYTFAGWSKDSKAQTVDYENDTIQSAFLTKDSEIEEYTLYGVWKDKEGKIVEPSDNPYKNGDIFNTSTVQYKKTGSKTVAVCGVSDKKLTEFYTFDNLTVDKKYDFNVTAVSSGACKNNKKITSIRLGKNITSIEKNAFKGCSNVNSIVIESKKIKKIGGSAFSGISKKVKIYLPKSKYSKYKKMLIKAGVYKKAKFYKQ